jgi:hypothetical protein
LLNNIFNKHFNKISFIFRSYSQDDSFSTHIPVVPTPPSSPHIEFLRQQYANIQQKNYFHPATYNFLLAQQQCGYTLLEGNLFVCFFSKINFNNFFF